MTPELQRKDELLLRARNILFEERRILIDSNTVQDANGNPDLSTLDQDASVDYLELNQMITDIDQELGIVTPFKNYPFPETHCQKSETGRHEPDLDSVSTTYEKGTVYLDVNCKHCGQSGCFGQFDKETEVEW